jgi:hypothetical protein
MHLPNWMVRDIGAPLIQTPTDIASLSKYGIVAGAAIALIAPNRYKTAGLAVAAVFTGLLIINPEQS